LTSLERMEYRGYDSAGLALTSRGAPLLLVRSSGRVRELQQRCADAVRRGELVMTADGPELGLGHTRWATHGEATERNAHPHVDCSGRIAVVHNGIIENADALRRQLDAEGHVFRSDVDTEVVPHLLETLVAEGLPLPVAMSRLRDRLEGSWAIAAVDATSGSLVATTRHSPLLLGEGPDGLHLASDSTALSGWVREIAVLEDGDVVELGSPVAWWDASGRRQAPRPAVAAGSTLEEVDLRGHSDFMSKEIAEQPKLAGRLVDQLTPGLDGSMWGDLKLPTPRRIRFVGCGTSLNASAAVARVFREVAGVPSDLEVASEVDQGPAGDPSVLTIAVSQSGETADVLNAVRQLSGPLLAITNNDRSSLARRADATISCQAGVEIGVAATKTFTAQVLLGTALGLSMAAHTDGVTARFLHLVRAFLELPARLEEAQFLAEPTMSAAAADLTDAPGFLFLSRGAGLPYAREGALKLKELTYRWAEAYPAGELKHGPIALVTSGTPVVVVDGGDRARLESSIAEVRARGARVIRIGSAEDSLIPLRSDGPLPPWGPLAAVIPLQHLARSLALALGCDADKPRNLAKSVTVS
jgi:glucosamine--fructose-6-phosphate aminotransferase (isomerizing)